MSHFLIRPSVLEDASTVSALIQRTVREINSSDYSPAIIELICANFTCERFVENMALRDVFVATSGTLIVGTISLGGGKLHSLFVDPRKQRRGIGARLVKHLEAHAVAKGVNALQSSSSITARAFYERMGYAVVRFEDRNDGSTFLMSRTLR